MGEAGIGAIVQGFEAALVESAAGQPDALTVVDQCLDASGARVGKKVGVVGLGGAKDLHHAGKDAVNASAHVEGARLSQMASVRIIAANP